MQRVREEAESVGYAELAEQRKIARRRAPSWVAEA
jgi:hypothetical protein